MKYNKEDIRINIPEISRKIITTLLIGMILGAGIGFSVSEQLDEDSPRIEFGEKPDLSAKNTTEAQINSSDRINSEEHQINRSDYD